jgi:putative flippase GtrA
MIAAVISITVGLITNFAITKFYVIGEVERQKKKTWFQFFVYVCCAMISLLIVQIFLLIFNIYLGFYAFYVKLATIPVVFMWTVFVSRYVVFDKKGKHSDVNNNDDVNPKLQEEEAEELKDGYVDRAEVKKE